MKAIYPFMGLALYGAAAQIQRKPNFLIIQCDHLIQRVVGAYGQTQDCTLPIDEIASGGVTFSNAYVGCPLSQPSRAALWSGMVPHQTNVRSDSSEPVNTRLPENVLTLGSLFSGSGYETVHFGKTHDMGSLRGFKHKEPVAKPFIDPEFPANNDGFLDVETCEDAVAYLSNPPKEPFICIANFQNPHSICRSIGENAGVHTDQPIGGPLPELPDNLDMEDWSNIPTPVQYICCSHHRMIQVAHWNGENYRHYVAILQHYIKMVSKQVGSVLKTLYSTPAGRNTVVVIIADHSGSMASHHMMIERISFCDEMANVPLIFAGPDIKQQRKPVDHPLAQPTLGLLLTLCNLAGIAVLTEKADISLTPTLKGEKQEKSHPYIVSKWHGKYEYVTTLGRMMRGPRYKYTHYLEGNEEELYNMKKDPSEGKNLARGLKYPKMLAEHRALLNNYITHSKDDHRSLKVDADPRCRSHTPGHPSHEGPGAWKILKGRQFYRKG